MYISRSLLWHFYLLFYFKKIIERLSRLSYIELQIDLQHIVNGVKNNYTCSTDAKDVHMLIYVHISP